MTFAAAAASEVTLDRNVFVVVFVLVIIISPHDLSNHLSAVPTDMLGRLTSMICGSLLQCAIV